MEAPSCPIDSRHADREEANLNSPFIMELSDDCVSISSLSLGYSPETDVDSFLALEEMLLQSFPMGKVSPIKGKVLPAVGEAPMMIEEPFLGRTASEGLVLEELTPELVEVDIVSESLEAPSVGPSSEFIPNVPGSSWQLAGDGPSLYVGTRGA